MAQIFRRSSNALARMILVLAGVTVIGWWVALDKLRGIFALDKACVLIEGHPPG
jgi:hypothetical protein